jgi:hypothetical protein
MDTPDDLAVALLALERGQLDHRRLLSVWNDWSIGDWPRSWASPARP